MIKSYEASILWEKNKANGYGRTEKEAL